ncbi:MAG: histidine phosphatase family protein [Brevibacterium sp.]|uniref:histidine phosphatase family protein n=1 Tax=Brevibacterium sp. TaxID=1701 RepID=UPI00264A10F7|nr:histidine phosphatase family protein [Brevibacterium sp.]MDN5807161.1 histidine phosphatase family protein [Brevibacterium sp.]MDN5833572.1 histidine phosphatase family protein [Brevibacterium sp.]MDN5876858.1 histidine phosphatase family protein [Brevibacterium sp.]MDN5909029.1 histidine phosphatase family protein [Brevibacterium sp.]MDN6123097.1 histidine phosphatase family protein [Brevibacterium sp.]
MTRTVIFWRHGQTDYNVERRFQGQTDIPLNELGRTQAAQAASYLRKLAPELIVSSDLSRAADTADELASLLNVDATRDGRLRETAFGQWEGHTRDEINASWPEELQQWLSGADMNPPGGESRSESGRRVSSAITDIVERSEAATIAIVAHGAVLRAAAELLLGMDGSGRLAVLGNCGHGEFGFTGSAWVLRSWGTVPS